MRLDYNVKTDRSIVEYRYKYKKRTQVLKRYTTKQVNDYDKENGITILKGEKIVDERKHLLLEGRNWWLIDGTYYQVPKPLTLCWFRNLHKGIKITGGVVLGLAVVLGVGGYFCIKAMNRPCADIRFDEDAAKHATIENLHFDESKNLICNIKTQPSWIIYSIEIRKGDNRLENGVNYTFDSNYKLFITADTMELVPGTIYVSPNFTPPADPQPTI